MWNSKVSNGNTSNRWGLQKFVQHQALQGESLPSQTQYLKNDTLYFRVTITKGCQLKALACWGYTFLTQLHKLTCKVWTSLQVNVKNKRTLKLRNVHVHIKYLHMHCVICCLHIP